MFERTALSLLQQRMDEPRQFMQVLQGPRQVGKTTLVRQLLPKLKIPSFFCSADDTTAANAAWLRSQWEAARLQMRSTGATEAVLVIDEIQKIQNWSETVKAEWDRDTFQNTSLKIILLGSARLLIQQGLSESLAGRFEVVYMPHWSLAEMEAAFGFSPEQFVWFGGYPGAAALVSDEERWRNYLREAIVETTLFRDVLQMARIEKPALLRRLFELGAAYSGQILSYTKILGQLQDSGNTATLAYYQTLLDAAGLLGSLENYHRLPIRSRASIPKWQVYNSALMSAQSGQFFASVRQKPEDWGRWVETAVGAHLLNAAACRECQVFYWRERDAEVDFVIERSGRTIGIEVKSGGIGSTKGMATFSRSFQPDKMLLVGNRGLPWEDFLKMPVSSLF
ncbi:MAG: ATP-binding protein [Saprospiraceae bacterium]